MQIRKTKTTIAIALTLMLTMASFLMIMTVNARIRDTWPTWLLLSVGPNPIGVGQPVTVNMIFSNPTPTARGALGDRYEGVTLKIVRPDGTTENAGPFMCDPTGGTYMIYTPATTGNYTFQAFYPGQTCDGTNPSYPGTVAWGYGTEEMWGGVKLLPDESEIITLNVQTDPVEAIYHTPPLPTEYWTRNINAQNWEWGKIAGNWMDRATVWNGNYSDSNVQYYTTAPNSPHILWSKMTHLGGVVGAPTDSDQESQYMLTSMIISYISDPKVLNGIMYYHDYIGASQTFGGATGDVGKWHAVDIRTGQELWSRTAGETGSESIQFVLPLSWHSIQEFGAWGYIVTQSGSSMRFYDAKSGAYLANITGTTSSVNFLDFEEPRTQGTAINYYTTSNQSGVFLNKWNLTQVLAYRNGFPSSGVHASTIRVSGNYDFYRGLQYPGGWTKKIDTTYQGQNTTMSVSIVTPEVIMMRYTSDPTAYVSANIGWQLTAGYNAKTGDKLWGPFNQTLAELEALSLRCYDSEVYVIDSKTTRRAWGYSIKTGQQIWGPVQMPGNAFSHLSRTGQCAYGKAFISDFGGYVNCIDLATGNIDWTFNRPAGYDTPFNVYPQWYWSDSSCCDGKLFLKEGHEYNPPQFPGRLLAINTTTGELVWSILFTGVKSQIVHADGIAVDWNANDGNIYSFGKGPTQTTVKIEDDVTTFGHKVLVTGSVMDVSAGTKQSNILPRFPGGVPAISDEGQREWMEYVYMQQIKPADPKGVDVVVSVYDPNGNCYDVGTATSDVNGRFQLAFDPEVPGEYRVFADFAGSESYWPSSAETGLFVEEAPAASPTPTPEPASFADMYFAPISIGMIAAIVVIVILLLLMLFRKR